VLKVKLQLITRRCEKEALFVPAESTVQSADAIEFPVKTGENLKKSKLKIRAIVVALNQLCPTQMAYWAKSMSLS